MACLCRHLFFTRNLQYSRVKKYLEKTLEIFSSHGSFHNRGILVLVDEKRVPRLMQKENCMLGIPTSVGVRVRPV